MKFDSSEVLSMCVNSLQSMCKGTRDNETGGNESFTGGKASPQPFTAV